MINTSLAKILIVFYILTTSNATDNLLSKQFREYIHDNRYMQHILGFITMFVLMTLLCDNIDTKTALFYALVLYIWFIFSTKLDIHWNIIILILLFVGYMIENDITVRNNEISIDNNLSDEQKINLVNDNKQYTNWIVGSILLVTVIGTLFYSHKKQEQYGGGYDVFVYMLQ